MGRALGGARPQAVVRPARGEATAVSSTAATDLALEFAPNPADGTNVTPVSVDTGASSRDENAVPSSYFAPAGDLGADIEQQVVVPLYRLQRDPVMCSHFGQRLTELDDLTADEYAALREYAVRAEAAVRDADREAALLVATSAVGCAIQRMRDPLRGRCQHCWSDLAKTPGLAPGARYDSENCKAAAQRAAQRRARRGGGSAWLRDDTIEFGADETLYVLDQVASMAALGVVAFDLAGDAGKRLMRPFESLFAAA
jgi:hypothetical protein